jgi:hypothetical protein
VADALAEEASLAVMCDQGFAAGFVGIWVALKQHIDCIVAVSNFEQ